ncbi:hypothetical protein FRB90_009810 [Tulasnella sp. 427]|nr:hypothetical protein FRB90_009810 [Tulasnella sp. 427]
MEASLEESIAKERALSDMHEKLSEIVKLYDRILTEQIANPARRYGDYSSQYSQQYQPTAPSQYAPPAPPTPVQPAQYGAPQQHQWAAPSQPYAVQSPSAPPQMVSTFQVAPVSVPPPPTAIPMSPPPVQQFQVPSGPPPGPVRSYSQYQQPTAPQMQAPPPPTASPVQHYQQQAHPQSTLTQAPVAYGASQPPPVMNAPPTLVQAPGQAPPPLQYAPSAPLPNFPSAPTSAPVPYASYSPAFEQKEQKEAMLISFD